jgi:hypothetical protein
MDIDHGTEWTVAAIRASLVRFSGPGLSEGPTA